MPTIEIAVPFRDNWYFDTICSGVEDRAARQGTDTAVFLATPGAEGRALVVERLDAALATDDCVGAVAVGFEFRAPQIERLVAHGKPIVVIGGVCPGLASIYPDDESVARAATEHLLDLGHTSIAHLAGYALSPDDFTMRSDRVRGYSTAMSAAGLEALSHVVPCEFTYDAAYRAATTMLSAADRPTAVFAVADELAFPVLDAAKDLGLDVPRDLSVIGIDDRPDSEARGLTTWRQAPAEIGIAAAERVLGVTDDDRRLVELTFVPRRTTARPAGSARTPGTRGRLANLLRRRG